MNVWSESPKRTLLISNHLCRDVLLQVDSMKDLQCQQSVCESPKMIVLLTNLSPVSALEPE